MSPLWCLGHLRPQCSKFHAFKKIKRKEKLELFGSCAKKSKPVLSENNMLLKKVFNALNSGYVYLLFSFFQPSSHFSWDTHSKQSFRLDKEGFLWLSLFSFGSWSNSFDLCRTLYVLDVLLSCICASYMHCFCIWSYFYAFVFVCVKIQNRIKSKKFKKFDCICLSTYHM